MPDDTRDWSDGHRGTGTGIGTPDVDTGDPATMGKNGRVGGTGTHSGDTTAGTAEFDDPDDMTGGDVAQQDVPGRDNVND